MTRYVTFTHYKECVSIPENYSSLVSQLIHARSGRRLSQEELAHRIGCSQSLIHKWETMKRVPSGFMLTCWLDALEYEILVIRKREV
jgi:transcriptional regulator with XRE-family HTH domain